MNQKPEVGMTVFLRPTIYNNRKEIQEGVLEKIGRKYYTVLSHYQRYRFDIADLTMESDASSIYSLYFSKEQLEEAIESDKLYLQIQNRFSPIGQQRDNITLEELRIIARIVGVLPPEPSTAKTAAFPQDPAAADDWQTDEECSLRAAAELFAYERLRVHAGHNIVVVLYGENVNASVECEDCNEVLYSVDNPNLS